MLAQSRSVVRRPYASTMSNSLLVNPLMNDLMLVYMRIGESALDFEGLRSAVSFTLNPLMPLLSAARRNLNDDAARTQLLEQFTVDIGVSGEKDPKPYKFEEDSDDDDDTEQKEAVCVSSSCQPARRRRRRLVCGGMYQGFSRTIRH